MLGYIDIQNTNQNRVRKYIANIQKINDDEKIIDIRLNNSFDKENVKDIKKIIKKLNKQKIDRVILSNDLYDEYKSIIDEMYVNNILIISGNILYINMMSNILKYIFSNCKNVKLAEINLGIAIDILSYGKLEFIKNMSNEVRQITIYTQSDEKKFDSICDDMLKEYGIVIKCSKNIRNAFKDCNVCINFDYDSNEIIKGISNRCMYITCNKKVKRVRKTFKGIVINDVNVDISDIALNNNFEKYSSLAIAQSKNPEDISRNILSCTGINGNIDKEEFEKFNIYRKVKKL